MTTHQRLTLVIMLTCRYWVITLVSSITSCHCNSLTLTHNILIQTTCTATTTDKISQKNACKVASIWHSYCPPSDTPTVLHLTLLSPPPSQVYIGGSRWVEVRTWCLQSIPASSLTDWSWQMGSEGLLEYRDTAGYGVTRDSYQWHHIPLQHLRKTLRVRTSTIETVASIIAGGSEY